MTVDTTKLRELALLARGQAVVIEYA